MKLFFARYFSTTSVSLKAITANKATGLRKILKSEEAKLAIICPPFLTQVLVGCFLGDLTARKRKYTYLKFEQSIKNGLYLIYLFSLFYDFCGSFPNIEKRRDTRNDQIYYSIYFCTMSLSCFDELYELFYLKDIKRIPPNISELLTPISLAFWIAEDGGKHRNALMLNTNSYTKEEVNLLSSVLNQNFGFSSVVYKKLSKGKTYYIIYIPVKDMANLRTLVLPYLHSSMHYKLGINSSQNSPCP
jgi:hypothetical protein